MNNIARMRIDQQIVLGLALASTLSVAPLAGAATVEGAQFPDHYEWNGAAMRLNGVGVLRYRIFIKGYVAALYLGKGVTPVQALADVPRRIEIEYRWSISAADFVRVTNQQISRNSDEETFARLRSSIDQLNGLYTDVRPGDRYSLTYVPGVGTELALNSVPRGLIAGAEFSAVLFALWIGPTPVDVPLRKALLSGS
jgi:hypothetical protein